MKSEEKIFDLLEKGIIDTKEAKFLLQVINKNKITDITNEEIDNILGSNTLFPKILSFTFSILVFIKKVFLSLIKIGIECIKVFLIIFIKIIILVLDFISLHLLKFFRWLLSLLQDKKDDTTNNVDTVATETEEIHNIDPITISYETMTKALEEEQVTQLNELDDEINV